MSTSAVPPRARGHRPPATSARRLESVALALFAERGFEATTVDDIAAAAGIGRRTFFRYYESKNDVVWGDFTGGLADLADRLAGAPPALGLLDALTAAVVEFNHVAPLDAEAHRERMRLILRVPALQAHSTLRYAEWRLVVATFVADRLEESVESLRPQLVAHAALAAALTAYELWLDQPGTDLGELLRQSFGLLSRGLSRLS